MTLATPAMAQTPQTGTIESYRSDNFGAKIYVKSTVKWNATYSAWKVDYSVNINLVTARANASTFGDGIAPLAKYDALVAKYNGKPWYQMRYANTHTSRSNDCAIEKPAAYNSELIGGTGWYRSFFVAPGEKTCLTVFMYGDSIFSPSSDSPYPMGVAYFLAPPAPSP